MIDFRLPQLDVHRTRGYAILLILVLMVAITACRSAAISFYPTQDYVRYPAERTRDVLVLMGAERPRCPFVEIGTIDYDWARDGIATGSKVALAGIRREAAKRGASGIYKVEYIRGMMGELGAKAVAYRCQGRDVGYQEPEYRPHVEPTHVQPDPLQPDPVQIAPIPSEPLLLF
jgi:hypothetical protein